MNRRDTIIALLVFGASSLVAGAQQTGKVYRIGFLRPGPPPKTWVEAFQQGLRERGYIDGKNVVIEYRWPADGNADELPRLADELVRLNVEVIFASAVAAATTAKKATAKVPIVFAGVPDPVENGLVLSLAHPGGNVTGLGVISKDLAGKRLEMLKELVPGLKRVAILWQPENPSHGVHLKGAEAAARILGVQIQSLPVHGLADFENAFKSTGTADALLVLEAAVFTTHRVRIAQLAAQFRLPTMYGLGDHVKVGGLISYGADFPDIYRRATMLVDKILKGAKPRDLPVEQPARFELLVNQQTANSLGLKIPQSVLIRATEVIQ